MRNFAQASRPSFHHVYADSAVNMNVYKTGQQCRSREIDLFRGLKTVTNRSDLAVSDKDACVHFTIP